MEYFVWLEQIRLGVWLRESQSLFAFPAVLVLHTIGMAFLAGTNAAVILRIMGFASGVPLSLLEKFFPVMWFGLVVNAASGILLLIAYPTKALTNPVFYLKLGFIVAGLAAAWWIRKRIVRNPDADAKAITLRGKLVAGVSLMLWAGAIISGRFLAYTCTYLMTDFTC